MCEIFDITYKDIAVIKDLWEKNRLYHQNTSEFFGDSYRLLQFEDRIKPFGKLNSEALKITVARCHNEYVGYCISTMADGKGEVQSLHVEESQRGKGIGQKLMTNHLEWMKGQGCTEILVAVSQENQATIEFYKKLGFYPNFLYMQQK